MRRPQDIAIDESTMQSMRDLTSIFEGIASMRITQIKDQVAQSQQFFDELWNIYSQIRVADLFQYGRGQSKAKPIDKELIIVITAEGGFSGDIDEKLINLMLKNYQAAKSDIIVIGHHGAIQLAQRGVSFKKYYKLPEEDHDINTWPIIQEVQQYKSSTAYYQTYVSLMVQDVKHISLGSVITEKGQTSNQGSEVISLENYIFEPSAYALIDHLERSMMQITISQIILESKLAQYASRFRAMSEAYDKADESLQDLHLLYSRAKRSVRDERLKEIINGIREVSVRI